jgi:hypothetical protein
VSLGSVTNTVAFFRSTDNGVTWGEPQLGEFTLSSGPGSVDFSFNGELGLAGASSAADAAADQRC